MSYCYKCMVSVDDNIVVCPFCGKVPDTQAPLHHLLPGTVLNGKYLVGKAIGEGGFGITYVGRDMTLDLKVAIKEFFPTGYVNRSNTSSSQVSYSTEGERREFFLKGKERFLHEARILAKFSSEQGIVGVRDFFELNDTAYIVMEFLEGVTLREMIKNNGPLPAENVITLLRPIMESLNRVHKQNLIHRDISPDNIMFSNGEPKLLDFGAARTVSAVASKSLSVVLKPGYAPEEQYRSKGEQGPWTDIYAICATMYKCITGVTPDDATQRAYRDDVKRPSELGIEIPLHIENVIMKGMSIFYKDRYQNMDDLMRDLYANHGMYGMPYQVQTELQINPAVYAQPQNMSGVKESSVQQPSQSMPAESMPKADKPQKRGQKILIAVLAAVLLITGIVVVVIITSGNGNKSSSGSKTTESNTSSSSSTKDSNNTSNSKSYDDEEEDKKGLPKIIGTWGCISWISKGKDMLGSEAELEFMNMLRSEGYYLLGIIVDYDGNVLVKSLDSSDGSLGYKNTEMYWDEESFYEKNKNNGAKAGEFTYKIVDGKLYWESETEDLTMIFEKMSFVDADRFKNPDENEINKIVNDYLVTISKK